MNKDETLKFALDVLKNTASWNASQQYTREQKAIKAIKAALEAKDEQPAHQQESVAEAYALADKVRTELDKQSCPGVYMNLAWEAVVKHHRELAYTSPQPAQRKPLTDEEIDDEHDKLFPPTIIPVARARVREFARAIEAKLREKNAAQPAVPLTLWTEAQHERAYRNSPELHKDVKSLAAFKRVAKEVAAMYGITEQKGQP